MIYYKFTKINKDKTEDEEFIESSFKFSDYHRRVFIDILRELKARHLKDNWRITDLVFEACEIFNTNFPKYKLKITKFPYQENFYV